MTATSISTSTGRETLSPPHGFFEQVRWLGVTGIFVAIALSVLGWLMVMSPENNGSVVASIGILFMTAPVVLARRWPILAVGIVAVAASANGLLADDIVRCGATLPALLYITFAVGSRSRLAGGGWARPLLGLAIAAVALAAQRLFDPVLDNGFVAVAIPVLLAVWAAGLGRAAVEQRNRMRRDKSPSASETHSAT